MSYAYARTGDMQHDEPCGSARSYLVAYGDMSGTQIRRHTERLSVPYPLYNWPLCVQCRCVGVGPVAVGILGALLVTLR